MAILIEEQLLMLVKRHKDFNTVMTGKMIKLIVIQFLIPFVMDSTKIELTNPDGQIISFYKVERAEKLRLIKEEVDSLYGMFNGIIIQIPIHRLKNGDLLLEKTRDDYAFIFKDEYNLELYTKSKSYYILSVHFEDDILYYSFRLTHPKLVELMGMEKTLIAGYESKEYDMFENKYCDYKTYYLLDKSIFRVFKRAENNYYGAWFPDMKTFEFFYFNEYTP